MQSIVFHHLHLTSFGLLCALEFLLSLFYTARFTLVTTIIVTYCHNKNISCTNLLLPTRLAVNNEAVAHFDEFFHAQRSGCNNYLVQQFPSVLFCKMSRQCWLCCPCSVHCARVWSGVVDFDSRLKLHLLWRINMTYHCLVHECAASNFLKEKKLFRKNGHKNMHKA